MRGKWNSHRCFCWEWFRSLVTGVKDVWRHKSHIWSDSSNWFIVTVGIFRIAFLKRFKCSGLYQTTKMSKDKLKKNNNNNKRFLKQSGEIKRKKKVGSGFFSLFSTWLQIRMFQSSWNNGKFQTSISSLSDCLQAPCSSSTAVTELNNFTDKCRKTILVKRVQS